MNRRRIQENNVDDSLLFNEYFEKYNNLMEKNLRILSPKGNISYFAEHKMALLKKLIRNQPTRILEYGCGIGNNLPFLRKNFPTVPLFGCDTSEKSLDVARQHYPDITFFLISDEQEDTAPRFDCVLVADVIHHIPHDKRDFYMKKILEYLEPGGDIVFFEHNPYNPLTRILVSTCPFDKNAELVSLRKIRDLLTHHELIIMESRYCFYFPEFLKYFNRFESLLSFIPLGGKFYVHAVRNP
jgi:SAM-dependent methyltransferase